MKKEDKIVKFLEYRGISTTRPLGNVKTKKMDKAYSITEDYNAVVENINKIFGYEESYITAYDVLDYDKSVGYHFLNVEAAPESETDEAAKNVNEVFKIHPFFMNYALDKRYQQMIKTFNTEKVLRLLDIHGDWAEQTDHLISKFAIILDLPEEKQCATLQDMYLMLRLQPVYGQKFSKKVIKMGDFNLMRAMQLLCIKPDSKNTELIKYVINKVADLKVFRAKSWKPLTVEDYVNILNMGDMLGQRILDKLIMNETSKEEISEYLILQDMDLLIAKEAEKLAEYESQFES